VSFGKVAVLEQKEAGRQERITARRRSQRTLMVLFHLSDFLPLEGQWFLVWCFLGAPWRAALFGSTKT